MDDGTRAHRDGLTIADCPYAPADPAGNAWRSSWIAAEAQARHAAGTFGASDDDYRRAGITPPARRADGSPVVTLTPEQAEALAAAFREAVTAMAQVITDVAKALNGVFVDLAKAVDWDKLAGMAAAAAEADKPQRRHRPCPIHGDTSSSGGMCRPCARGTARRHGRR